MAATEHVTWHEEHVRGERGREARYYLKRREGDLDLVVVGRERGIRHMVYDYVFKENFWLISPFFELVKLRSRRDVVDWLNSVVSGSSDYLFQARPLVKNSHKLGLETLKVNQPRKPAYCIAESIWVGTPWTCRKRRSHYPTFLRSGVQISINDFVFVLAEENKRLVAFLDDMYEDSRGNKMVVVRWFHKIDEVGIILPHDYNDREIFFSLCLQDLSIECIDGLATVLSPQHFEKFRSQAQLARLELFVCQSLFDNDEVTPFDITQIKGYWKQSILSTAPPKSHVNSFPQGVVTRPKKRLRRSIEADQNVGMDLIVANVDKDTSRKNVLNACASLNLEKYEKPTQDLALGSQVEVLSEDSGLRGCWFRAVVIKKHKNKVKVQYVDIKDAEDEAKNLQEWLPASKVAVLDPLGLRLLGRKTIRPAPVSKKEKVSLLLCPGTVVDVWWHDGWWEAIVLQKEHEDKIRVYFPGEKQTLTFACGDLRLSKEWLGKRWVSVKERPDLVTSIFSDINEKQAMETRNAKHNKPAVDNGNKLVNAAPKPHTSTRDDFSNNKYSDRLKWGTFKRRSACIVSKRKNSPANMKTRVFDDFFISNSLKVDRDNCKYMGDCTYRSSVVSTLTSLVMSR